MPEAWVNITAHHRGSEDTLQFSHSILSVPQVSGLPDWVANLGLAPLEAQTATVAVAPPWLLGTWASSGARGWWEAARMSYNRKDPLIPPRVVIADASDLPAEAASSVLQTVGMWNIAAPAQKRSASGGLLALTPKGMLWPAAAEDLWSMYRTFADLAAAVGAPERLVCVHVTSCRNFFQTPGTSPPPASRNEPVGGHRDPLFSQQAGGLVIVSSDAEPALDLSRHSCGLQVHMMSSFSAHAVLLLCTCSAHAVILLCK